MEPDSPSILVVEDHCATRRFLADNLAADGYRPLEARSVAEARGLIAAHSPQLAILDLGLPDRDGLELLRELREPSEAGAPLDPALPVMILSGRGGEVDRVRGFERGCDDYLVKPFSYSELRARVGALLRRTKRRPASGRIRVGGLLIDPAGREVSVAGERVRLSAKEFELLSALAADPCRVFTREELLRDVWGYRSMGATRTLDSHASRLRRKLAREGESFIVNVWGVGYRLLDGGRST